MSSIQELTDRLGTGWKIIEPKPQEQIETKPNPAYDALTNPNVPQSVQQGTGLFYIIVADPDGHQRALYMRPGPIVGPSTQGGPQAVQVTGQQLPSGTTAYNGDLANLNVWEQAGAVGDVPAGPKQPTPTLQLDKLDADGNDATKSGKPVVQLRDPATGTVIDIPKDPSGSLTTINKTPYLVKPDGTATVVTGPDGKPLSVNDKSTINVPGKGLVEYDPSKSGDEAYHVVPGTEPSTNRLAKDLQPVVRNGKTYIAVDSAGGIVWQEAKDEQGNALPTETTYTVAQNDARSPNVLLIDAQGNSKLVSKGPDWKPPPSPQAGQALTPDTTAPHIVTIGDDGKPVFTDNPNRLSINDAQKQLIQQLGIKVANGDMSEDAAQKLITSATQSMTAQAAMINAQANQQQQVAQTGG